MKIEIFKGKGKKKQFYTGLNQGMGVMKTGTKEWAKSNLNFQLGCEHGCRYCYAREMAVNRFKRCPWLRRRSTPSARLRTSPSREAYTGDRKGLSERS